MLLFPTYRGPAEDDLTVRLDFQCCHRHQCLHGPSASVERSRRSTLKISFKVLKRASLPVVLMVTFAPGQVPATYIRDQPDATGW